MFGSMFGGDDKERKYAEFAKLATDPTMKVPEVGDRVVVAIGLFSHIIGFPWSRGEGLVIEVGEVNYKVKMYAGTKMECDHWIHPTLITDVLKKEGVKTDVEK